jgi:ketol-acid reductoisomerase
LFFALEYVYFGSFNSLLSFQVRKFLSKIEEGRNLKAWKYGKKNPHSKLKGETAKLREEDLEKTPQERHRYEIHN